MRFLILPAAEAVDGRADEDLIARATELGPVARIWDAPQGLVVPRTYAARPGFVQTCDAFSRQGWPIAVRQSGGGVVPQGPGILNLSLALPIRGRPLDYSDALYQLICEIIQAALRSLRIESHTQAVEGSFCDGRFNLAVGAPGRKVAGTAQVWRGIRGAMPELQIGLVHALILANINPIALTEQANRLELSLGTSRRYQAERIASLDTLAGDVPNHAFPQALRAALDTAVREPWPEVESSR